MTATGVHLRRVDPDNVRAACNLELEPEQARFVAPVSVSLAEAYAQPHIAWPRLVYDGDRLVGFVMAYLDEEAEDFFLWRLNIARGHQRKGYGRFAVEEVAREAHRRGATELRSSYVPGADGPAGFYDRLGFEHTGEIDEGELVVRLPLDDRGY
jgi:diamine N-acetyltransferase